METLIMRGKPVADAYRETIMQRVANALGKGRKVTLAIIVVGDDPASHVYKDRLMKLAEGMGIYVKELLYPADTKQEDLLRDIARMNHNRYVTGVLPMMPMPKPLDSDTIGAAVTASKDVDCLNVKNVGDMYLGYGKMSPCTPRACMATLEHYGIELEGKHAVVIGRSNVVGGCQFAFKQKCYCYHLPQQNQKHCRNYPPGGYYRCGSRQTLLCNA